MRKFLTSKKFFKSEVNFASSKDRASLIIYSLGIIYFFIGLRFYFVSPYGSVALFAFPAWVPDILDKIFLFFYYPFFKNSYEPIGAHCTTDDLRWCYFTGYDAIYVGSLILISTYVIRWILTKKFNPLPWK